VTFETHTERRPLVRGHVRLERGCRKSDDRIIRVPLGKYHRQYSYVVRGPVRLGDSVEVHTALSGWVIAEVVGFGRAGYDGPLKRGRVLR
jgi:hypothetical protein